MRLLSSLLCFASLLAHIHSEDVLVGIVGETFTFPVEIKQRIEEITWTKNKDKVAVWERQNTSMYFTSLQNRSVLKDNGCLTIFGLEKNDSGTYELHYWDSLEDHYLTFILSVLDPPSEPKISWSIKGDNLVLNCTSDFQRPLNYSWKLSNDPRGHQGQEFSIPIENADVIKKATCLVTFSQTEKSSEISLIEWISEKQGYVSHKRTRIILIVTSVFFMLLSLGIVLILPHIRGRTKLPRGQLAQNNSLVHGSGEREQLFPGDSEEQHNSDRVLGVKTPDGNGPGKEATATFSQPVHYENEKPEADRDLNKKDSALQDDQTLNSDVNQEELSTLQNSTRTSKCAADHCVTEERSVRGHEDSAESEVTQDAEGGNGEHLNKSSSCSKEDLNS